MSKTCAILFIQLLSVHYVTQSHLDIEAVCGQDVILPCPGLDSKDRNFLSVIWSKVAKEKLSIVKWSNKGTRPYNFSREARFGENHSLMLPRATPEDSGKYECSIRANVGGQNQYHNVKLTVPGHECVTERTTSGQFERTTTWNSTSCHDEVHDLPIIWSAMGYMAVALVKIALSLISIWVNMLIFICMRTHTHTVSIPPLDVIKEKNL